MTMILFHPTFWMEISIVSRLSQPCSFRKINGQEVSMRGYPRQVGVDDKGIIALEDDDRIKEGWGEVIWVPCTPIVQSR